MRITAGPVPLGENFYKGRQRYVDQLQDLLGRGDVLVLGPRRTGKTCTIQEYIRQSEEQDQNFTSIYVDLEPAQDLYEFYLRILREICRATSKWSSLIEGVNLAKELSNKLRESLKIETDLSPYLGSPSEIKLTLSLPKFDPATITQLSNNLCDTLKKLKHPLLIVLDEFPELIWKFGKELSEDKRFDDRREKTEILLSGLRSIRQEKALDGTKHRFVLAGSVNLFSTLKYLKLEHAINDILHFEIPYLQENEVWELLELLCKSENINFENPNMAEAFIKTQFGKASPFFVQVYAERLNQLKINRLGKGNITEDDIKASYKHVITSSRGPAALETRIKRYYEDSKDTVFSILKLAATTQFSNKQFISENDCFSALKTQSQQLEWSTFCSLLAKMKSDDMIQSVRDGSYLGFESQIICNFWNYSLVGANFLYDA